MLSKICAEKQKTRKTTKLTPTVAIADEFVEYQRRVEKEKKEKTERILKRRAERLQKQNERKAKNLMVKKRKTNTENKIITSQKNIRKIDSHENQPPLKQLKK